jgi:hypothetical protein
MPLSRLSRFAFLLLIPALVSNREALAAGKPIDPVAIKAKVQARGVGQGVRVTLADKTEAKGIIVNIGEQNFTVKPKGADQPREIGYAQVTGVHNDRLSTGQRVTIAVVIAGAAIGIVAAVLVHSVDNSLKHISI